MRKILTITASIVLAVAIAYMALCVYAATYTSSDDPLITLSYVNKVLLPEIGEMIDDAIAGKDISGVTMPIPGDESEDTFVEESTDAATEETTEESTEATTEATTEESTEATTEATTTVVEETAEPEETLPLGTVSTGARYDTVNLKEGQTLYASVYSCEVIVRSGSTKVVSPFTVKWEEQGVSDTTEGKDIYNDEAVPNNHTIIIPRDDGRGIVTLEGGAWVMVRGDYIIKDADGNPISGDAAVSETVEETVTVDEKQ